MPRALLSVSDKAGIVGFANQLRERGWAICSTGGTAAALRDAGIPVQEVSDLTSHPEILGGRVKTLHPAVHAGLLARANYPGDTETLRELGYPRFDLLAVNLYPFRETVAAGAHLSEAIEQIDIGGPAMLRSAAKNHERVWAVVDPADYDSVVRALGAPPTEGLATRRRLAAKAFACTADYDAAVVAYLSAEVEGDGPSDESVPPDRLVLSLRRQHTLRYGENPGQAAALYTEENTTPRGIGCLDQFSGKALSYNNLLDVDGALFALSAWTHEEGAACVIIKHATPCGLALGADAAEAYRKAVNTDPLSAFGSVVGFNVEVSAAAAAEIRPHFVEVVAAPRFDPAAAALLSEKKNLRLIALPAGEGRTGWEIRRLHGAYLAQQPLSMNFDEDAWQTVTTRTPTGEERADLRFAWRAVAAVKSNAIVVARGEKTLGIGAGQMSRVDASRLAVRKARDNDHALDGAVLASDAFFPFRDGVDAAAEAGIGAIVQPGGSIRDEEVIAAADEHGITMVFTGRRVFRH